MPITLEEAFRTANGPAVRSGMYTEDVQNNIKREIRDRCLAIEMQLLTVEEDTALLRNWKLELRRILSQLQR